ncbi:Fe-S cluster assembly sulfur transfer protein SufU [Candidatus Phytoplasma solani]|uniref:Iron-sulfur cluster assembly scaffold protein n=1 Tax=Candidatus Phytoplasma solani TaxID=69896 RepID=A0A421NXI7_9MOLU
MLETNKLYRDLIMKHYQNPHNWGLSKDDDFISLSYKNASCGDSIILQIKLLDQKLVDIKYETQSCAICKASASLMSIYLKNNSIKEGLTKINNFLNMINNEFLDELQMEKDLLLFKQFSHFPGRRTCILLPWKALQKIIINN